MKRSLRDAVRERARHRCEYCLMPERFHASPFQVDHVVARQHRGRTEIQNLALSCIHCNAHKGPNLAGVDPVGGATVLLFNPRTQKWADHFAWVGAELVGRTACGRATVEVLAVNEQDHLAARAALMSEGVFDAEDSRDDSDS